MNNAAASTLPVLASTAAHALSVEIDQARRGYLLRGRSIKAIQAATAAWIDQAFERGEINTADSALLCGYYNIAR